MQNFISKQEAAQIIRAARVRSGVTWAQLAEAVGRDKEWTTAALLGYHPMTAEEAAAVKNLLNIDDAVVEALQMQPYRTRSEDVTTDPTIYRFYEALQVYGPAMKELIHEEFGDGIMSAINFKMNIRRRTDPGGDRVVITFDGKFLDYNW